jgi:MFS family permease
VSALRQARQALARAATVGALRHRNFRLFIAGQFVSLSGTWMQSVALSWLVFELTGSTLKTGLVTTLSALPVLLFTLYGGTIADRVDKRRALLLLQTLFLLEAIALGVLAATGVITVPLVYALAAFAGLVSAFEIPIRQAYLMEMVGRADLLSAIALNSSAFNLSRVVGPALAAFVSATFGAAACFFVNAASFLAVLAGLLRIDPAALFRGAERRRAGFRDGIAHVLASPRLRALVTLTTVFTLFAASLIAILPAYAGKELGTAVGGYGGLVSAFGVGAALGALTLAAVGRRFSRERVALSAGLGLGASVLLLGVVRSYPVAAGLLMAAGLCMALNAIMTNTVLQTDAPDHLRGQVIGLYAFIVIGMAPFGSAQAAWVGERFGPSTALALGGAVCLVAAVAVGARRGLFRRRAAGSGPHAGGTA